MRRVFGAIIGFGLFFPGALVLRWLVVDELHLYQAMTLTDALLAIIIILACVLIFGQPRRELTPDELEEQARRMETASRRLERAQRAYRSARARARSSSSSRRSDRSSRSSSRRSTSSGSRRSDNSRSGRRG